MSRSAWPTVATGDGWSASQNNTFGRDNDAAYWQYTTAGDLVYATSVSTLARLAIGAAGSTLAVSGGVPAWVAKYATPGLLHAKGTVNFAPAQTFSGGWADITGATLTLTTSVTCTILVIANVTGYNATDGRAFYVRSVVAGAADAGVYGGGNFNGGSTALPRNEAFPYIYYATGITAAANVVKLQCQADTATNNIVTQGRLTAFAFVE